jgi:hypothetical protein
VLTPAKAARCWVLADASGQEWPDDWPVAHHVTELDARGALRDLREDHAVDPGYGPADVKQLDAGCLTLTCDGCGVEYESDEVGHVHWPTDDLDAVLAANDDGWCVTRDGTAYCGDCAVRLPSEPPPDPNQLTLID